MKTLSTLLLLAAGCTVMVNGKPRRIGGSDPTPEAQAQAPAAAPQPGQPAAPPPPPSKPGQVIKVDGSLTSAPLVADIGHVAFDTTYTHVYGLRGNSPDCGNDMTSQPIASIELKQQMPSLEISVEGGSNDGFVLRSDKGMWFACEGAAGVPAVSRLKEGWQPGRYDIYAVSRYGKNANHPFSVEVADPSKPVAWREGMKEVVLKGKLAAPMFVEVTTSKQRRIARKERNGWGCEKAALPEQPDLALVLERPIPGLVVRPLPGATEVVLRKEQKDVKNPNRGCPSGGNGGEGPSYHADHELHFEREAEGTFGLSVGTADPTKPTTVTLMIFDSSTKFDALTLWPNVPTDTLAQRWVGRLFPQLEIKEIDVERDWAHAELAAKLFALAPKTAFVYSKLDLDKDTAWGTSDQFPVKNEALLVLGIEREQVSVLAADGIEYKIKDTHLLLAPDGEAVVPAKPRSIHKVDLYKAVAMLPPADKKLGEAHQKRLDAHEKCVDRVWEPYGRQLPSYSHPAGVDIVVYESPRTRQIKEAGNNAVDRTCGTRDSVDAQSEKERVKMVAAWDKARVKLLADATTAWH